MTTNEIKAKIAATSNPKLKEIYESVLVMQAMIEKNNALIAKNKEVMPNE